MQALDVQISPEVLASDTLRPLVERASDWLREELPDTDEPARAEWTSVVGRRGEELVALTLKDQFSSPTRVYSKATLQDRDAAGHEFSPHIRAFLRNRSHAGLKRLRGMLGVGSE